MFHKKAMVILLYLMFMLCSKYYIDKSMKPANCELACHLFTLQGLLTTLRQQGGKVSQKHEVMV